MNPLVVGGGIAGLAAACRLAGDGHRPHLLERAPHLGGRAGSFYDRHLEETVDFGQHVLMGCCTAARGFLKRIGAEEMLSLQPSLSIPVRCETRRTILRSSPLPGPLHLLPSLLRYAPLSPAQRVAVLRAAVALLAARERTLESRSFGGWLKAHRQSDAAITRLWDPICIAALNAPAGDVSAGAARMVFAEAFFRPGGANLGCFTRPLSDVAAAAADYIRSHGGLVETGAAVRRIVIEEAGVRGVELSDGRVLESSAVVSAVPPDDLAALVPADSAPAEIADRARRLAWAPIVNVHLWFDRPVTDVPFFIAVDAPIQAVFDVSRLHAADPADGRHHIVVSQSAAEDWMGRSDDEIATLVRDALAVLEPGTQRANLLQVRVLRQPRATFVPAPCSPELRPAVATPVRGLTLAGDWTWTGWPSTLESAVRSGVAAAARLNLPLESDEPNAD